MHFLNTILTLKTNMEKITLFHFSILFQSHGIYLFLFFISYNIQFQIMYTCLDPKSDDLQKCSVLVRFHDNGLLESGECRVDIARDNVVVVATKAAESHGMWAEFEIGLNTSCTEVCVCVRVSECVSE